MAHALTLADRAEAEGEVPVGAVVVRHGVLIAEGWNRPIASNDPTAHAEIIALRAAATQEQNYRLPGSTLYVTLEPCSMCAGAMVHARVERLVFATHDPRTGAGGSLYNLLEDERLNHQLLVASGLLAEESGERLRRFFRRRREEQRRVREGR